MLKLCQLNVNSLDNLKKINELNKWEKFKHTIDKEEVLEAYDDSYHQHKDGSSSITV